MDPEYTPALFNLVYLNGVLWVNRPQAERLFARFLKTAPPQERVERIREMLSMGSAPRPAPENLVTRAIEAMKVGQHDAALDLLQEAVTKTPSDAALLPDGLFEMEE